MRFCGVMTEIKFVVNYGEQISFSSKPALLYNNLRRHLKCEFYTSCFQGLSFFLETLYTNVFGLFKKKWIIAQVLHILIFF